MKKNILFVIALPIEAKIIKQELENIKNPFLKISFLITGVGNYNAIYSIKDYLDKKGIPDFVVNMGVCGKNIDFTDFFQVYRIKNSANKKESLIPLYFDFLPMKSILSSEKVITNTTEMFDENFCDMESFGIDFILSKENIPFILIKKPFDFVGEKSMEISISDLENNLKGFDYNLLFQNIIDLLNKKNKTLNIDFIDNILKLTFSQKEILKKKINKEISFGEKIESIKIRLSSLKPEEILQYIKNSN